MVALRFSLPVATCMVYCELSTINNMHHIATMFIKLKHDAPKATWKHENSVIRFRVFATKFKQTVKYRRIFHPFLLVNERWHIVSALCNLLLFLTTLCLHMFNNNVQQPDFFGQLNESILVVKTNVNFCMETKHFIYCTLHRHTYLLAIRICRCEWLTCELLEVEIKPNHNPFNSIRSFFPSSISLKLIENKSGTFKSDGSN